MSILRTYNLQNPDSATTNIELTANGGAVATGIVTATGGLNVGAGGTVITTTAGGNVGVGTDNPLTKLNIFGTGNGSSGSTGLSDSSVASALLLKPTVNSGTSLSLGSRDSGGHYIQGLYYANPTTEVRDVQINPYGGSVGIGTFADAFGGAPGNSTFVVGTTGIERFRIDSSGRVTHPYQISWFANKNNSTTVNSTSISAPNIIAYNDGVFDIGSSYSSANSKFTAPVSGKYFYSFTLNVSAWSNTFVVGVVKNGSFYETSRIFDIGAHRKTYSTSGIIDLAQNDYIEIGAYVNTGSIATDNFGMFCGYLLG